MRRLVALIVALTYHARFKWELRMKQQISSLNLHPFPSGIDRPKDSWNYLMKQFSVYGERYNFQSSLEGI